MWWDTDGLWWVLAFCCLFFPVAGYHMEGWPTAAIYALATSLALLGHTDNTERAASFFEDTHDHPNMCCDHPVLS